MAVPLDEIETNSGEEDKRRRCLLRTKVNGHHPRFTHDSSAMYHWQERNVMLAERRKPEQSSLTIYGYVNMAVNPRQSSCARTETRQCASPLKSTSGGTTD